MHPYYLEQCLTWQGLNKHLLHESMWKLITGGKSAVSLLLYGTYFLALADETS